MAIGVNVPPFPGISSTTMQLVVVEPSCLGKVFTSRKVSLVLSVTLSLNRLQFTTYVTELEWPDLCRLWPQLVQLETWTKPVDVSSC
jgi:hypothetical protein